MFLQIFFMIKKIIKKLKFNNKSTFHFKTKLINYLNITNVHVLFWNYKNTYDYLRSFYETLQFFKVKIKIQFVVKLKLTGKNPRTTLH